MKSLAVKYRPKIFDEVVEEGAVIKILKQQLETNSIKNSYIFSGASGCGKTTVARIFANEINRNIGNPIELDAASNNGVDNVKQIVASASERSIDSEYKVYIVDEAHMLTTQAWNAFLKCIEETPRYTIFIFCTTDAQKIPDTIKNRCMRFNFYRLTSESIENQLNNICIKEGYSNYTDTINYISRICNGEMRNAISLLETCVDYNVDLSIDNCLVALGDVSYSTYFDLLNSTIDGNYTEVFSILEKINITGVDVKLFVNNFTDFIFDIIKYTMNKDISVTKLPISYVDKLNFAVNFDDATKYYNYMIDKLLQLKLDIKSDNNAMLIVKIIFNQICRLV